MQIAMNTRYAPPSRIWKYALMPDNEYSVEMPAGAEVLCVQVQGSELCIWAKVSPSNPPERRWFGVRATGQPFTRDQGRYVGTFQLYGGGYVGHLFELVKPCLSGILPINELA